MKWLAAPDTPLAWLCLVAALLFLLKPVRQFTSRLLFESSHASYNTAIGLLAFGLSVAYVHTYLAGGPRIIDATTYLLQARILADGSFAFSPPGALSSFNGRFLLITPEHQLAGIFPPGYPLILALGVWIGLPLVVNPMIGAALGIATSELGRLWFDERTGRLAGVLSALCATLRYHSADTMSHAWAALLVVGTLLSATWSVRNVGRPCIAGLCAGWLFATRPLTGLVFIVAAAMVVLYTSRTRLSSAVRFAAGLFPGIVFWALYQWATTGTFSTTQGEYYTRGDFPAGCFSLGFGADIGCHHEHGDFLSKYQPAGFGLSEAWDVTTRRLGLHHIDIANLPGFGGLVLAALFSVRKTPALGWTLGLVVTHMAAYAMFYFDGNYPGGGARLFVDVLPLQHVLLGWVLVRWRAPALGIAACLLGFALCGSHLNQQLKERDGGRPMFESAVVERFGLSKGLLYMDTDHGFNLAFDPSHISPAKEWVSVRYRGDASDAALWRRHGKPPAYRYRFNANAPSQAPWIESYTPVAEMFTGGANLWPPAHTQAGSGVPTFAPACGFGSGLALEPAGAAEQHTELALPAPPASPFDALIYSDGPLGSTAGALRARHLGGDCYELTLGGLHATGKDWMLPLTNTQPRVVFGVRLIP